MPIGARYNTTQITSLKDRLSRLTKEIRIAIIGIGSIGKGLVFQANLTAGMRPVVIADIDIARAINCASWLNLEYEIVTSEAGLNAAIRRGKLAVTDNGALASSSALVDVMIESSNAPYAGAMHAMTAIENGLHVVMMNFEAELLYGPLLMRQARQAGVVYTCADGDQPTVIKKLIDDISLWGFDLVMAGNIKGFHDRYTNPTKISIEADKRSLDHKMCSSYTDGTKLCVEMAVLANAINARTVVPGMMGMRATHVHDIFKLYDFDTLWDKETPLVDYIVGAEPRGGVFVIGHTKEKFQQYTLNWFPPDMGPGPYYLFYRPYHLGHIEAMQCVAEAFLDGTARLQPVHGMKTNVFTYAKRDLKAGERLDGMGGYASYGLIENLADNRVEGLPILLNEDLRLTRDVKRDERINLADVEFDASKPAFTLYDEALRSSTAGDEKCFAVSEAVQSTLHTAVTDVG